MVALLLDVEAFSIFENHCVKSVRIRCYYGPHFSAFGLNTSVFSPNAGKYGPEHLRMRTLFTQWILVRKLVIT